MVFNHHNGFTQCLVGQDFARPVDVSMLIEQGVTGLIDEKLDAGF